MLGRRRKAGLAMLTLRHRTCGLVSVAVAMMAQEVGSRKTYFFDHDQVKKGFLFFFVSKFTLRRVRLMAIATHLLCA